MNQWDEAARKAADSSFVAIRRIIEEHPDLFIRTNDTQLAARDILRIAIEKHHAALRATYERLVELVILSCKQDILWGDLEMMRKYNTILSDPLVVEAMKEGK